MPSLSHIRKALVVEDDYLIAQDIALALQQHGCGAVRIAASMREAVLALAPDMGLVTLDIRLKDGDCGALAARLAAAEIPFLYVTGFSPDMFPDLPKRPRLTKPVSDRKLVEAVLNLSG